jgi:hypothetical protein
MINIINVDSRPSSVGAVNRVGSRKLRSLKNFSAKRPDGFCAHRASYTMCTACHVHGIKRQEREAEHLHPYIAEVITVDLTCNAACIFA